MLLSPDSLCAAARRHCLPGLCTHQAVVCDLQLRTDALRPADPCGRQFALKRLPASLAPAVGELAGLALWWGMRYGLAGDSVLVVAWEAKRPMVPLHGRAYRISEPVAVAAGEDLGEDTGVDAAGVKQW